MTLDRLAQAVEVHFVRNGSIDDSDESIQLGEAVAMCSEGHAHRATHRNNLALSR